MLAFSGSICLACPAPMNDPDQHRPASASPAGLDALVKAAALACRMPLALVSVMEGERHRLVVGTGFADGLELCHGSSFARCTLDHRQIVEVHDLEATPGIVDRPSWGAGPVRFYAGHPMRSSDGSHLGTLSLLDHRPRQLCSEQRDILDCLSQAAAQLLEAPRAMASSPPADRHGEPSEQLAGQHECLRVTLQAIGEAVITTDAHGRVTWMNPVAERLTGHRLTEACDRQVSGIFRIVSEGSGLPIADPVSRCLSGQRVVRRDERPILIARRADEHIIEETVAPILDRHGATQGAILVFRDVTEQHRLARAVNHRACHDALTGLLNRAAFERLLARSLQAMNRQRHGCSLMFIDLDRFKLVNDACGHAAGDRLLTQMSRLLSEIVGDGNALARLGGDEFGVLIEHPDPDRALRIAQRICERMEGFRFIDGQRRHRIGTSIGLVPFDARWNDVSAAMQSADASCHAAKQDGRNRVHVWSSTDPGVRERRRDMRWAARVAEALDQERFVLHLQRILPLAPDDDGVYAEILIRLQNANGSLVLPASFLPAAERYGFSARIDRWVLRQVIDTLLLRAERSDALRLFVNLSGRSIEDRRFQQDAIAMLAAAGPAVCSRLCLEVTETAAIADVANAATFIERMQALGVRAALDDFGAGAASYGYLRSLPVDTLKIDGQFVSGLVHDPLNEAAVQGFVRVAGVMRLTTVAEGVDSAETLQRVRALGADFAQGYHLHRPEPFTAATLDAARVSVPG